MPVSAPVREGDRRAVDVAGQRNASPPARPSFTVNDAAPVPAVLSRVTVIAISSPSVIVAAAVVIPMVGFGAEEVATLCVRVCS